MKVIDHINQAKDTLISFEVLPPLKGKGIEALYKHLDPLMVFNPSFINVTYHRSEHVFKKKADGNFEKVVVRKRPGTESICAAIMNKYNVDTVPHLICGGFSVNDTEDALINLNYLGIDNVLVLRGDAAKNESAFEPEPGGHKYAVDLLRQVVSLNDGIYLEEELRDTQKTKFCIGVAGYPEKHFEAPNKETDLLHLKQKVDTGADYIITQMFFDNKKFFEFETKCREAGINVPIIPGLKPLATLKQLNLIPHRFQVDIPQDLTDAVFKAKDNAAVSEIGVEWCINQSKELKEKALHLINKNNIRRKTFLQ